MKSIRQLIPVLMLLIAMIEGCALFRPSVYVHYQMAEVYADSSRLLNVWTSMGSDSIGFGGTRISEATFRVVDESGDTVRTRFWYPAGRPVDTGRLVLLIPPHGASDLDMFPLATELTRRGIVTAMISPRGTGRNARLAQTFGLKELEDIGRVIRAYRERHALDTIRVGAFGSSLGSVVALNLVPRVAAVQVIVLEGTMYDLDAAARRVLSSDEYREVMALFVERGSGFANYSPGNVIPILRQLPVLALWGSDDQLVGPGERSRLRELLLRRISQAETAEIAGAAHSIRYGFPLAQADATAVNVRIADFLERHLR